MKASAYPGLVVADIAIVQCGCATVDLDTTSILPNNKARQQSEHPKRAMEWFHGVESDQLTDCEHTREPHIAC